MFEQVNTKKITYILFAHDSCMASQREIKRLRETIQSVLHQDIPLCDLVICVSEKWLKVLEAIVKECLLVSFASQGHKQKYESGLRDKFEIDFEYTLELHRQFRPQLFIYETVSSDPFSIMDKIRLIIRTEWVALLRSGVCLRPQATCAFISTFIENNQSVMVYADQDYINKSNRRVNPLFKPRFSLDFLYSNNYIGTFYVLKTNYFNKIQFAKYKYSFRNIYFFIILFVLEKIIKKPARTEQILRLDKLITHIPYILHSEHLEVLSKSKQHDDSLDHLEMLTAHLTKMYANVHCDKMKNFFYRLQWPIPTPEPLVSIIIPTKNGYHILKNCVNSILNKTSYRNYEILIVDNQSTEKKTLAFISDIVAKHKNIKRLNYDKSFNYSDLNNKAVKLSRGKVLAFVNNDTEVIHDSWLSEMVSHSLRADVGCVGAMLYYPDGLIQHAGVVLGMHGVADHAFVGLTKSTTVDRLGYLSSVHNPEAVTAAVLVVRRNLFNKVGGFDSRELKVAFNDVDLCLKISRLGYRCVWTPYAELFHYESKTRNNIKTYESNEQTLSEHRVMKERWGTETIIKRGLLLEAYGLSI
jgi:GT2 family glycosyltransferase